MRHGAFVIVISYPFLGNTSYFIQTFKNICIQDLIPVGFVEAFNVGILCRFPRLDISKVDLIYPAPNFSNICYKFRSILYADFLRLAVAVHQMVQYPDYPRTFQTVICLNVKDFPVVIINHIKTAELSSTC